MFEKFTETKGKKETNETKEVEKVFLTRESFDRQLTEVKSIEVENGSVEYTVIEPEVYQHETPVLFVGGFSQGKEVYAEEMYDLASSGRKVIFSNPLRGIESEKNENYEEIKNEFGISDTVMAKVAELEAVLGSESGSAEKIDLLAHSQGGVVATVLTKLRPDLANNLVLQGSESFQGEDGSFKASLKFTYMIAAETVSNTRQAIQGDVRPGKEFLKVMSSFTKEYLRDIIWKMTKEVPGSVQVDIFPILEAIKKDRESSGEGPHVTMLTAYSDTLSDFSKQEHEPLNDDLEGLSKYIDTWAMYAREEAGHPAPTIELPGLLKQVIDNKQ